MRMRRGRGRGRGRSRGFARGKRSVVRRRGRAGRRQRIGYRF